MASLCGTKYAFGLKTIVCNRPNVHELGDGLEKVTDHMERG